MQCNKKEDYKKGINCNEGNEEQENYWKQTDESRSKLHPAFVRNNLIKSQVKDIKASTNENNVESEGQSDWI